MITDYGIILSIGTFLIAAVGVPFALWQLWLLNRTARSNAVSVLYDHSARLRNYFVSRPDLRKYFFDNQRIEETHEDFGLVLTIAEIYLNFQEHKTFLRPELGSDWQAWKSGRDNVIATCPIMRELIRKNPEKYTREFRALISQREIKEIA